MKETHAVYFGRIVDKKNFRAFVYGPNGQRKIVESWDAFESAMQSGIWFASSEEANEVKQLVDEVEEDKVEVKIKPKLKSKPKPKDKVEKVEKVEEPINESINDEMAFEVTEDEK